MMQDQQTITLIADPRVIAIPVVDNGDPFIDLRNQTLIVYGPSPEIPDNQDYTKMRKTVYEKLVQAQTLLPNGIRFCLYEAYRSLDLQTLLFNNRHQMIRNHYPAWSEERVFTETTRLVSPVINFDGSQNIPPHATGGAIDVYLIDEKGQPLDMGIHPGDWLGNESGSLCQTNSALISQDARNNRAIMNQVLETVGFVNYPTEYWHWSYGDRYWAYQLGQTHAIYGTSQT